MHIECEVLSMILNRTEILWLGVKVEELGYLSLLWQIASRGSSMRMARPL